MLTARAAMTPIVTRADPDSESISIFAHRDNGILSVGLNAV
jgi:hypothetical protein